MTLTVRSALKMLGGARRAPERQLPDISEMDPNAAAEALLRSHLDEDQQRELTTHETFVVTSQSGRQYLVGVNGSIDGYCIAGTFQAAAKGNPAWAFNYCSMLATKLLLETNEALVLYVADDPIDTRCWEDNDTRD